MLYEVITGYFPWFPGQGDFFTVTWQTIKIRTEMTGKSFQLIQFACLFKRHSIT